MSALELAILFYYSLKKKIKKKLGHGLYYYAVCVVNCLLKYLLFFAVQGA